MIVAADDKRAQLERILDSETFRAADSLRRLLLYLGEKSILGKAEELKEYTIGVDAFGKPASYDPRHDSIVRLQVGRLRQRLGDYYRGEGRSDPLVVDVPKGHFKVVFGAPAYDPPLAVPETEPEPDTAPPPRPRRLLVAALCAAVLAAAGFALAYWQERRLSAPLRHAWTTELATLWAPVLESGRPLIISIADPLFVVMGEHMLFRDWSVNSWEDAAGAKSIDAVRKALDGPQIRPTFSYVLLSEVNATFMLGRLLAGRQLNVSLSRSMQLSWQMLSDDDCILIGSRAFFAQVLLGLPVTNEFILELNGVRDLRPQGASPAFLADTAERPATGKVSGTAYAIIAVMPGPLGKGTVISFGGNPPPARIAAVQWFTDPVLARTLVSRLRGSSARIPRYYEVVLKVDYRDDLPVETSYVTHRELYAMKDGGVGK